MSKKHETIKEALVREIQASDKSTYRLWKDTGVSATVIQRFLRGERDITLETAARLAEALDLVLVPRAQSGK